MEPVGILGFALLLGGWFGMFFACGATIRLVRYQIIKIISVRDCSPLRSASQASASCVFTCSNTAPRAGSGSGRPDWR